VALVAAVVLAGLAIVLQNLGGVKSEVAGERASEAAGEVEPVPGTEGEAGLPPAAAPGAQFEVTAKLFVRMTGGPLGEVLKNDPSAMPALENLAANPDDRMRAAVVASVFEGREAAGERLAEIESELATSTPDETPAASERREARRADAALLRTAVVEGGAALAEPERERLIERHGFFGRLAVTSGLDDDAPERAPLLTGGTAAVVLVSAAAIVAVGAVVIGFGLLVTGIVLLATGRMRFRMTAPRPGGSVYLEVYALFVGGFLAVGVLAGVLALVGVPRADVLGLLLPWVLLLAPLFWPRVRGQERGSHLQAIGLTAPRGVWREIGAGVLGYLACVPLFVLGTLITIVLNAVWQRVSGSEQPAAPHNPVVDLVASNDPWLVLGLLLMAVVWAPLVEELVFRGALYRHLRGRLGFVAAGLVSALLFAFMHSYGPLFVTPLVLLGFGFAVIREWRGSLTACITAHAVHNGTLMIFMLVMFKIVAG
jgi:membrane protease YdiL (CAAX protease family)